MDRVEHTIPPFVFKEAKVLILGSIPSPMSRSTGFYYGHPQNRFWKVLSGVFGQDTPVTIEEKKEFLRKNKIALWDVLESCDIVGASDSSIKNAKPNDINNIIKGTEIKSVFTTGKRACDLLYKHLKIKSVCLPSTSPANCAVKIEELIGSYSQIKVEVERI